MGGLNFVTPKMITRDLAGPDLSSVRKGKIGEELRQKLEYSAPKSQTLSIREGITHGTQIFWCRLLALVVDCCRQWYVICAWNHWLVIEEKQEVWQQVW